MDNKEKKEMVFVDGFNVKKLNDNCFSVGIKWIDFTAWAANYHKTANGYVNLYIRKSKNSDKWYCHWNDSQYCASAGKDTAELDKEADKIPF